MNKKLVIILSVLIVFTLLSAMVSKGSEIYAVWGILGLAILKFIGVSFHFMELQHANAFWKGSILIFLALFSSVLIIVI